MKKDYSVISSIDSNECKMYNQVEISTVYISIIFNRCLGLKVPVEDLDCENKLKKEQTGRSCQVTCAISPPVTQ